MKYKIFIAVEVEAQGDHQAVDHASKLGELLKNPMVKMAIESEGIRTVGPPVVHMPQRNGTT
jgi:hypothetical protein